MKEISFLLGIDGGGTKTEFLLTDYNGNEIKRTVLGTSNPVNIGIENTLKILEKGIMHTCRDIDYRKISAYAGIAGGGIETNRSEIGKCLSKFGFGACGNASDTDIVIEAALGERDGVAVIMGTGIVAFACVGAKRHRVGGWGYLIDKGGCGFSLGADALESAFRRADGRGGSSLLLSLAEKQTGKVLTDSVTDIYSGGPSYIASFAPCIFAAFESGDKEAERILDRNAEESAEIIRTACSFFEEKSKKVVICGGLCRCEKILKPFLMKHLGEDYSLEFSKKAAVSGALSLAKKNGGKIC